MKKPTRHIVFSPSARGSLLQALKMLGRRDDVIALFDDLRCGPIDPFDAGLRERWFTETLRVDFEPGLVTGWNQDFWSKALDPDWRLIAWTTRHHAQDRLGFLLWLSRLGEQSGEVVDISEAAIDHRGADKSAHRPLAVSMVTPDKFVTLGLFDQTRAVTSKDKADASIELERVGRENGAFRQTVDGIIVSLPLTAFDDNLVAAASHRFRKAAFVIGTVLGELADRDGWYVSDLVLAARLTVLVEQGRLEAQGDPYGSIRFYEVRLPERSSS